MCDFVFWMGEEGKKKKDRVSFILFVNITK
jgi:hypothetical protein